MVDQLSVVISRYQELKPQLPDALSLRLHRSLSWLQQARNQSQDLDMCFMALWVAFNAAYAKDHQSRLAVADKIGFRDFLMFISRKNEHTLYQLLWQTYPASIRKLLDTPYVFQAFWDHHNQLIGAEGWQSLFANAKRKANQALAEQDVGTLLLLIFDRLYTLRNQLFHGGATYAGSKNRHQLKDACALLQDLMPVFLATMLAHPDAPEWGTPFYPVVD